MYLSAHSLRYTDLQTYIVKSNPLSRSCVPYTTPSGHSFATEHVDVLGSYCGYGIALMFVYNASCHYPINEK